VYSLETEIVYDHNFAHLADDSSVPHGIYDLQHNDAMINIGVSAEPSEFVCDSVKLWWESVGLQRYSDATAILILADGGESNSSSRHVFK
jgi:hypothetical protein